MATITKNPKKKVASAAQHTNKSVVKKSPAKKVVPEKKVINNPVNKNVKKGVPKKSAPVKAVVKKVPAKVIASKSVATGKTLNKKNAKQTTKDKITGYPVRRDDNTASSTAAIASATASEHDVNAASTQNAFHAAPSEQPDFKSNKKDEYHSKIQPGNKSKNGIKPSGKKPLW